MIRQIRRCAFETNSSSVHSLCIASKSEYDAWKNGELIFDDWNTELIPNSSEEEDEDADVRYYTYNDFFSINDYESFDYEKMIDGTEVHCFGYYGHDW